MRVQTMNANLATSLIRTIRPLMHFPTRGSREGQQKQKAVFHSYYAVTLGFVEVLISALHASLQQNGGYCATG